MRLSPGIRILYRTRVYKIRIERFRRITLTVHSSLGAVGLTAHVARVLAAEGIACNGVVGYYHDHLFVPEERAHDAMAALTRLGRAARAGFSNTED